MAKSVRERVRGSGGVRVRVRKLQMVSTHARRRKNGKNGGWGGVGEHICIANVRVVQLKLELEPFLEHSVGFFARNASCFTAPV